MVAPHRHFFDLERAAGTSQRLLRPRVPAPQPPPSAPQPPPAEVQEPEVAPVPEPAAPEPPAQPPAPEPAAPPAWLPFDRPPVTYKLELWDALLEWVRQWLEADGCFALDERGFLVASSGDMGTVPPEVFLSAFTATDDTVAPYTGSTGCLRGAMFDLSTGQVTMLPVDLSDAQVLLGLLGGAAPTAKQLLTIRRTMAEELERFESLHT